MECPTLALVNGDRDAFVARSRAAYDVVVHAWAMRRAGLVRFRRSGEPDVGNLADEVGDKARQGREEPVSRLSLVFQHPLTWDRQRERRSATRARTIREQRRQVEENPGPRPHLDAAIHVAFRQRRVAALNETGLPDAAIPEANPRSWDDITTRAIAWPEP